MGQVQKPVLVVLAAGMGSRYGGLKQMDPVGGHGQLILDYSIFDARRAGFETVIFVIKREMEGTFRAAAGDRISRAMEVRYAFQDLNDLPAGYVVPAGRVKPWGTCHAVLAARKLVDGPFAVINADDCYGPDGYRALYGFLSQAGTGGGVLPCAMVGYRLDRTVTENGGVARGICELDGEGYLTAVTERTCIEKDGVNGRYTQDGGATWTSIPGDSIVSMNFWGLPRSFLDEAQARFPAFLDRTLEENPEKGEYFLPSVISELIQEGRASVKVLRTGEQWYGVTYREDKAGVVEAIARRTAEGIYPENLWGI